MTPSGGEGRHRVRLSAGQANEATGAALVKNQRQKDLDIQPYPCVSCPTSI